MTFQFLLKQLRVVHVLDQLLEPVVPDNVEEPVSDNQLPLPLESVRGGPVFLFLVFFQHNRLSVGSVLF